MEYLRDISDVDPEVNSLINEEKVRQSQVIRLIPSENYASRAVAQATGSIFGNKYSEGYPYKWKEGVRTNENGRYYQGQVNTNALERLAIDRCLKFFAPGQESQYHANLQPLSGAPANLAVLNALLDVGDTFMGLSLDYGGHLTHGHKVNATSKFFKAVQYPLGKGDLLDFDIIRKLALEHRPKLLIAGITSYPRRVEFAEFAKIAKEVGAILMADVAHISGLVATGCHPHPLPHADVVTTTTHKILRGPRGGLIVCKRELGPAIDRSVFPGLQGGPHMNTLAGIAVALHEALQPSYRSYCQQVVRNASTLAESLVKHGFHLVTGGTDNHMVVIDMTKGAEELRSENGSVFAEQLEVAGIVLNKNSVPGDAKPWIPSGIRLGTPSITTIGMKEPEMVQLADWIAAAARAKGDQGALVKIRGEVTAAMKRFPIPA